MNVQREGTGITVLVVDDDPVARGILAERLTASGYVAAVAASGGEAVRHARTARPRVVVLDLNMPELDGWETAMHLRSLGLTPRPYIIALSGRDDARSRERAFEVGCDEYIVKGTEREDVLGALRAARARGALK